MSAGAVLRPVPTEEARDVVRALGLEGPISEVPIELSHALLTRVDELTTGIAAIVGQLYRELEVMQRADTHNLDLLRIVLGNVRAAARLEGPGAAALVVPIQILLELIARLERRHR